MFFYFQHIFLYSLSSLFMRSALLPSSDMVSQLYELLTLDYYLFFLVLFSCAHLVWLDQCLLSDWCSWHAVRGRVRVFFFFFFCYGGKNKNHCSKTEILIEGGEETLPRCLRLPQYLFVCLFLIWFALITSDILVTGCDLETKKDSLVANDNIFGSFQLRNLRKKEKLEGWGRRKGCLAPWVRGKSFPLLKLILMDGMALPYHLR